MQNLSIGQVKIDDRTNEITAISDLLELLDIKDRVVTIDVIGTQTKIVNKILEKEAHYCLAVKNNQPNLHDDIKLYFEDAKNDKLIKLDYHKTIEKGHGRIETREIKRLCGIKMILIIFIT